MNRGMHTDVRLFTVTVFALMLFTTVTMAGEKRKKAVPTQAVTSSQDTVLVCDGVSWSVIGPDNKHQMTLTITKENNKVVKVVRDSNGTYTLTKKTDTSEISGKAISRQLIVEAERFILRNELAENTVFDMTVQNTGAYEGQNAVGGTKGQCSAQSKVF